jgi:hypothetical protein
MFEIIDNLIVCDIGDLAPEGWVIVDVRDLTDFEKNAEKVKRKIMVVSHLLNMGERVCVRCACGINRSNTIVISVLCYRSNKNVYLDTDWDRHYNWVKKRNPSMELVPEIVETAKRALKQLYAGWK